MADLSDRARERDGANDEPPRPGIGVWLLSLVWLGVAILAIALVVAWWRWIPGIVVGLIVVVAIGWVFVSVLSPAIPNRKCPRCGGEGLVKIRRGEPGVRCELCGFRDETMHVAYLDEW